MEKWMMKNIKADFNGFASALNISPILGKLLINRDIYNLKDAEKFLNPSLEALNSPLDLKDMDKAINLVMEHIDENKKILIVGDYDVDGVISTYILFSGLSDFGANVDYHIPDRINEGYGINESIIRKAKEMKVDLIITCDNGIAALDQIKLAKELGLKVIVTDHHDISFVENESGHRDYVLPLADAVVNPKRSDCDYSFKKLCGAGIAFKLIQALYIKRGKEEKEAFKYLEFAAIATVCDVVDLVDENRIIVKNGLAMINNTKNIGLKALIEEVGLREKEIGAYHLGFIIGPSINATGRLESAIIALKLLLAKEEQSARELAERLHNLNIERQNITSEGLEKAIDIIESSSLIRDNVLVVYIPEVHESVAGIIAGRIREKYNLPSIVLTKAQEGVKGSGRSIEGYNMFEELLKCKHLLAKFGGHPMAAGLSLEEDNINKLREELNKNCTLTEEDIMPEVNIDMQMNFKDITLDLAEEIAYLEPYGKANSKPNFAEKSISVQRATVLGKNRNVLKLKLYSRKSNKFVEAIYFGDIEKFNDLIVEKYGSDILERVYNGDNNSVLLDLVFNIGINEYMGNRSIQLIVTNYRL